MENSLVIIPTYNEKENIEAIIRKVFSVSQRVHILVVDDGSPDGTADLVKGLQVRFNDRLFIIEREGKLGLGTAYIRGFKFALEQGYEFIFEMDADFSHNPLDLPKLYLACSEGADLSVGSRYKNGVNVVNWPMERVLMSFFASKYVKYITGLPLNDATAGFVCYTRGLLSSLDLDKIRFIGYAFQIEMKFKSWKKGYKIEEVPIVFTDRTEGVSKMSVRIFREAFWGVIYLRLKSIFTPINKY
ncbi:MAG: polyprenol monophosphomannose synthase [Cytophagales bacterium]|nr:polyprenol monophosphomannose synthase [Cytophagales bacterium]